ncbi:MAG: hypothetical protein JXR06_02950 [Candidatus Atelocyanobacterium thalassa]
MFVFWFPLNGVYDSIIGDIRNVNSPRLNPITIFSYQIHFVDTNSLADLVGGHIYIVITLILDGV